MSAYAFPFTEIEYPDSDGLPVAESDFQREYLTYAVEALRGYYRERDDVYVKRSYGGAIRTSRDAEGQEHGRVSSTA